MRIDDDGSRFSIGNFISIDSLFSIKTLVCFVVLFGLLILQTGPINMLINEKNKWHIFAYVAYISGAFMYTGMTVYNMYDGGEKGRSSIPWISVIASILLRFHLHSFLQKICFIICIIGYLYIIAYGIIPLVFDFIIYLLLMQTSLANGQIKIVMLFTGMTISIIVGVIWVKTAYKRKFWIKESIEKIIEILKRIDGCFSELDIWNVPLPDVVTQDIERLREKFNIEPYCENSIQKRKCMLAIVAIIILIKMLLQKELSVIKIIGTIPFWEFNDFFHKAVGDNISSAFWFYTISVGGLSALIINLIQTFLIGTEKMKLLSLDGICSWLMNIYIFGLCVDICYPIALLCAKQKFFTGNLIINILGIFMGFALICKFSESVKSIISIYFSVPVFNLFVALKLHNIALFIMLGINKVTHMEIFKNTTDILCLLVVLFMQIVFDILEWTGIYGKFIEFLKKLLSYRMLIIIPYGLALLAIPYILIMKLLF